ncbi:MAG: esterase-like activity of phytase family protein [Rhodocyclaceae bacterium]|nr:MAG: esterase-like activity of phytase family protein [Rhodocyclaceae bacterium]
MKKFKLIPLAILAAIAAPAAHAADLIALGSLTGSSAGAYADLSGLTGTLENGVAANVLGGIGSGLAWAGGNTFLALPDRGPNATPYNSLVDDTVSYISRFQTVSMDLTVNNSGVGLAYNLTPTLAATTLLSSPTALNYGSGAGLGNKADGTPLGSGAPTQNSAGTYYFTGRSDNFAAGLSTNPNNARLDPEGIRVSNDGRSVFVSDEYGPYVYQFDRSTGQRINTFTLPGNLAVSNLSAQGNVEISGNTTGRVANKGMEGLAITPDGKTLVGIMQAPLEQDTNKNVRIVTIDIATGTTHEYAYKLTTGSGVSEILAINDHEFLVDERDGKGLGDGSNAAAKQLFKINLSNAQDVTGLSGDLSAKAVSKSLFMDVVSVLTAHGISASQIPSKLEGLSWGQDLADGTHTLYLANDNDFVPGTSGPNNFYVFSVSNADLGTSLYQAQSIAAVPEPESYAMLLAGLGLLGFMSRRKRQSV